jgi:outer membrane protein W
MKNLVLVSLTLAALASTARADEPTDAAPAKPPAAPKLRRLYARAGAVFVQPLSQSRPLELSNLNGPASLALKNGPVADSGATIDSAWTPGIIVGYTLPTWGNRLSIETVLGLPFTVKFHNTGSLATKSLAPTVLGLPTGVMPLGTEFGEATAIPPVVTAVYTLVDHGALHPYVGTGLGVMFTTNAHATNPILTQISAPQMDVAPAPGLVLQTGVDWRIWNRVYARLDVKFIAFMLANATLHHVEVATPALPLFGAADVDTAKMSLWVNPLIVQLGIGTDF